MADGSLAYRLKTPWRDATTHVVMKGVSCSNGWHRTRMTCEGGFEHFKTHDFDDPSNLYCEARP